MHSRASQNNGPNVPAPYTHSQTIQYHPAPTERSPAATPITTRALARHNAGQRLIHQVHVQRRNTMLLNRGFEMLGLQLPQRTRAQLNQHQAPVGMAPRQHFEHPTTYPRWRHNNYQFMAPLPLPQLGRSTLRYTNRTHAYVPYTQRAPSRRDVECVSERDSFSRSDTSTQGTTNDPLSQTPPDIPRPPSTQDIANWNHDLAGVGAIFAAYSNTQEVHLHHHLNIIPPKTRSR